MIEIAISYNEVLDYLDGWSFSGTEDIEVLRKIVELFIKELTLQKDRSVK